MSCPTTIGPGRVWVSFNTRGEKRRRRGTHLKHSSIEIAELLKRRLREIESELALAAVARFVNYTRFDTPKRKRLTAGNYPK